MHTFTAKCVLHSLCNSFRYIRYFDDLQINVNSVRQIHLTFLIHKSHKLSIKMLIRGWNIKKTFLTFSFFCINIIVKYQWL